MSRHHTRQRLDTVGSHSKQMPEVKINLLFFLWRWLRYKFASWRMKNVDPMYPDMIKYVNDKNDFESTYGTGW